MKGYQAALYMAVVKKGIRKNKNLDFIDMVLYDFNNDTRERVLISKKSSEKSICCYQFVMAARSSESTNECGQLGRPRGFNDDVPACVEFGEFVERIAAGFRFALVLTQKWLCTF